MLDVVGLLETRDVRGVGPVLTKSHVSLRDDHEGSSLELDLLVDAALEAGALGARTTGAGFGGSAIALVEADSVGRTRESVLAAFREAHLPEPRSVDAEPGDGYGPAA